MHSRNSQKVSESPIDAPRRLPLNYQSVRDGCPPSGSVGLSTQKDSRDQKFVRDDLPESVQKLIETHIKSVEELEVLLLLSAEPQKSWAPAEVFRVIQSNLNSIQLKLSKLAAQGLLSSTKGPEMLYCYSNTKPELDAAVRSLREAYKVRPTRVIELIFANPNSQIRSFADAFKFRKTDG
jgi:hypothetical protein